MSQDNSMDYTGDTSGGMGDMGSMSDMSTTGLTASPDGEGLIAKLQSAVNILQEIIDLLGGSPEETSPDLNADDLNLDDSGDSGDTSSDTMPEPYSDFGDSPDSTKKYQSLKSLVESIRA